MGERIRRPAPASGQASADSGHSARAGRASEVLEAVVARWPSFPALSFGLWTAWVFVAFSGSTWLSPDVEENAANLSTHFACTMSAMAVALIACALASRRRPGAPVGTRAVVAAGVAASASCLAVILIGPHYLGSIVQMDPVFWVCSSIAGAGMGVVALRCGVIFGTLPVRDMLVSLGESMLLASFAFFLMHGCSSWAPVEGGPSTAGILFYVLLPLLAALLACVSPELVGDGAGRLRESGVRGRAGVTYEGDARRLPGSYWRLVALALIVSLVVTSVRGTAVNHHALAFSIQGNCLLYAFVALLALAIILVGVCARPGAMRLGRVVTFVVVAASSIIVVALPIAGIAGMWSVAAYAAGIVFEMVLWAMLSIVVKQKRISPVIVFGYGFGSFACGSAVGWAVSTWLVPRVAGADGSPTLFVVGAAVMIVAALALFSESDFEQLFLPSSNSEPSLPDMFDAEERAARYLSGDQGRRAGKFQTAIARRAERGVLSARETEVFRLLAMGYGSDRIASELGLSVNTVRVHTHNVYVKLDVHSRSELMEMVDADVARLEVAC
ncbi:MAG: LuxR family transcriptional regulator [Coriobacteriales bacterium]|jgi:DNA-binding CsgD family transcriptional regulator